MKKLYGLLHLGQQEIGNTECNSERQDNRLSFSHFGLRYVASVESADPIGVECMLHSRQVVTWTAVFIIPYLYHHC